MKKYFVFGDVHSNYDALLKGLNDVGFDINNPEHIIISLGDLLDRGDQPMECLKFVNSLPEDRKILIEGNHEDLLKEMLRHQDPMYYDYTNGTMKSVNIIAEDTMSYHTELASGNIYEDCKNNPELIKYLNSTVFYYDAPKHVFVHGWLPPKRYWNGETDWRTYAANHRRPWFANDGGSWACGYKQWMYGNRDPQGKTMVCGHWHTTDAHIDIHKENVMPLRLLAENKEGMPKEEFEKEAYESTKTFKDDCIICLDACTVLSNRVNVEVITEEEL